MNSTLIDALLSFARAHRDARSGGNAFGRGDAFEQRGAQVSFAGIGQHDDDGLAGVLRTLGDSHGDRDGGSARNAGQDSFFASEPPRVLDRFFVGYLLDFIDEREVQVVGHEPRTDTLNSVRPRLQRLAAALLRDDGTGGRLDRDRDDRLAFGPFDVARDSGDGAAGADAGHEDVDGAVGVIPYFRAGGRFVDGRIGGILELLEQDVAIRRRRRDFLGLGDRSVHAARAFGQYEVCAVGNQQFPALEAHRIRHRQGQREVAGGRDERERDAGVAAGRFDQFFAGTEQAALFRIPDHRSPDSAFYGIGRVASFNLAENDCRSAVGHAVEPHQRRVSDRS